MRCVAALALSTSTAAVRLDEDAADEPAYTPDFLAEHGTPEEVYTAAKSEFDPEFKAPSTTTAPYETDPFAAPTAVQAFSTAAPTPWPTVKPASWPFKEFWPNQPNEVDTAKNNADDSVYDAKRANRKELNSLHAQARAADHEKAKAQRDGIYQVEKLKQQAAKDEKSIERQSILEVARVKETGDRQVRSAMQAKQTAEKNLIDARKEQMTAAKRSQDQQVGELTGELKQAETAAKTAKEDLKALEQKTDLQMQQVKTWAMTDFHRAKMQSDAEVREAALTQVQANQNIKNAQREAKRDIYAAESQTKAAAEKVQRSKRRTDTAKINAEMDEKHAKDATARDVKLFKKRTADDEIKLQAAKQEVTEVRKARDTVVAQEKDREKAEMSQLQHETDKAQTASKRENELVEKLRKDTDARLKQAEVKSAVEIKKEEETLQKDTREANKAEEHVLAESRLGSLNVKHVHDVADGRIKAMLMQEEQSSRAFGEKIAQAHALEQNTHEDTLKTMADIRESQRARIADVEGNTGRRVRSADELVRDADMRKRAAEDKAEEEIQRAEVNGDTKYNDYKMEVQEALDRKNMAVQAMYRQERAIKTDADKKLQAVIESDNAEIEHIQRAALEEQQKAWEANSEAKQERGQLLEETSEMKKEWNAKYSEVEKRARAARFKIYNEERERGSKLAIAANEAKAKQSSQEDKLDLEIRRAKEEVRAEERKMNKAKMKYFEEQEKEKDAVKNAKDAQEQRFKRDMAAMEKQAAFEKAAEDKFATQQIHNVREGIDSRVNHYDGEKREFYQKSTQAQSQFQKKKSDMLAEEQKVMTELRQRSERSQEGANDESERKLKLARDDIGMSEKDAKIKIMDNVAAVRGSLSREIKDDADYNANVLKEAESNENQRLIRQSRKYRDDERKAVLEAQRQSAKAVSAAEEAGKEEVNAAKLEDRRAGKERWSANNKKMMAQDQARKEISEAKSSLAEKTRELQEQYRRAESQADEQLAFGKTMVERTQRKADDDMRASEFSVGLVQKKEVMAEGMRASAERTRNRAAVNRDQTVSRAHSATAMAEGVLHRTAGELKLAKDELNYFEEQGAGSVQWAEGRKEGDIAHAKQRLEISQAERKEAQTRVFAEQQRVEKQFQGEADALRERQRQFNEYVGGVNERSAEEAKMLERQADEQMKQTKEAGDAEMKAVADRLKREAEVEISAAKERAAATARAAEERESTEATRAADADAHLATMESTSDERRSEDKGRSSAELVKEISESNAKRTKGMMDIAQERSAAIADIMNAEFEKKQAAKQAIQAEQDEASTVASEAIANGATALDTGLGDLRAASTQNLQNLIDAATEHRQEVNTASADHEDLLREARNRKIAANDAIYGGQMTHINDMASAAEEFHNKLRRGIIAGTEATAVPATPGEGAATPVVTPAGDDAARGHAVMASMGVTPTVA